MPDSVGITTGTDALVATDAVTGTGEEVQLVKLAYSANGSDTHVEADADGLHVQAGASGGLAVTAADATGMLVEPRRGGTAAHTRLYADSSGTGFDNAATEELVASNVDRLGVVIQNTGDVAVYLGFGTAAATTTGLELGVGATYSDDVFYGAINAIPASDSGGQEVRAIEFD